MSSHNFAVLLTPEAQDDFEEIRLYTRREWGHQQEAIYKAALLQALATFGDNPGLGRRRDDLGSDLRSYIARQHVIYYRLAEETITVLRILHSRVDVSRALRDQP